MPDLMPVLLAASDRDPELHTPRARHARRAAAPDPHGAPARPAAAARSTPTSTSTWPSRSSPAPSSSGGWSTARRSPTSSATRCSSRSWRACGPRRHWRCRTGISRCHNAGHEHAAAGVRRCRRADVRRVGGRGGRRCRRRPRARRTSSSCCSTTSATRSSAATAPTSPRRASTGSPAQGHRYSNFHTTALCSPTRACLLTGRNHHSNGMARIVEFAAGFPGYNATIPHENGFLSEILVRNGYATFAVGKWHLTPASEMTMGSPRDKWPLGRGLRALLRVHGRRDRPVPPGARVRQPLRRAAAHAGGGLPPHRGPGRPGDPLHEGPARHRARQAVLPLVHARARATRRTRRRRSTSSRTAASSTWGGTRGATQVFAAPGRPRACCPRAPGCPSARRGCRRGTRSPTTSATSTPG